MGAEGGTLRGRSAVCYPERVIRRAEPDLFLGHVVYRIEPFQKCVSQNKIEARPSNVSHVADYQIHGVVSATYALIEGSWPDLRIWGHLKGELIHGQKDAPKEEQKELTPPIMNFKLWSWP